MFTCPQAVGINSYFGSLSTEQHYVGLVLSRPKDNHLQDKVYAFYNERNKDTGAHSSTWLPYVTQVCMVRPA